MERESVFNVGCSRPIPYPGSRAALHFPFVSSGPRVYAPLTNAFRTDFADWHTVTKPIDYNKPWPSAYADGGTVEWTTRISNGTKLQVSFPNIRWNYLRATEGWAALQHHAILRTTLTLIPPLPNPNLSLPQWLVTLKGGSYFTIVPHDRLPESDQTIKWYAGDVYSMESALPRPVMIPLTSSTKSPITYDLFVSGDYEIRLFGDPHARESELPIQNIDLSLQLETVSENIQHEETQGVVCDFVDGYAFGDAMGIALRSVFGWWTIIGVATNRKGITLTLQREIIIAPSQTRIIPIHIAQHSQVAEFQELEVTIITKLNNPGRPSFPINRVVKIPFKHHKSDSILRRPILKGSYFYAQSMPTAFLAIPPTDSGISKVYPPTVALHGAGVDILHQDFWANSLPKNKHNWILIPTGKTSWGTDWHGPSALDIHSSLSALSSILEKSKTWNLQAFAPDTSVALIGHSNGGQGVWHFACKYPNRVLGVVAAAGYIKSQAYVPLTMSRSSHFIDPMLRAILESSLTADDNDLHLSNLVDIPIFAVHGGSDENVPVWHSREYVGIVQTWSQNANIALREDKGYGHWDPEMINTTDVESFIDRLVENQPSEKNYPNNKFTLTVSNPGESGSVRGCQIERARVPGRLSRLKVEWLDVETVRITTMNVKSFLLRPMLLGSSLPSRILVDDSALVTSLDDSLRIERLAGVRQWGLSAQLEKVTTRTSYRMQDVLLTQGPLVLVVADTSPTSHAFSMAIRIAHDLNTYLKLDSEIIHEGKAIEGLNSGRLGDGNVIFIGNTSAQYTQHILGQRHTPFNYRGNQLYLKDKLLEMKNRAVLFLHPHPTNPRGIAMFILYSNPIAGERAGRLFPIRTGIPVPQWVIMGDSTDSLGAAGVEGAGIFGDDWEWNEPMSWLY